VLTIWQCQTHSITKLENRLVSFLGPPAKIPTRSEPFGHKTER
jgi:hypothetical protein